MITVSVPARYIAALMLFAQKDDVNRRYLESVLFEIGSTEMRLVATDGKRLGLARIVHDAPLDITETVSVIVPRALLEGVKANLPLAIVFEFSEAAEDGTREITMTTADRRSLRSLPEKYPNYRQVLPKGAMSGVAAQFDPRYISDLMKARKILTDSKEPFIYVGYNGDSTTLVNLCDDNFIAVLVPFVLGEKSPKPPTVLPAWANDDLNGDSLV